MRLLAVSTAALTILILAPLARSSSGPPRYVDRALHAASHRYRVPYREMRDVSYCESRWNPYAVGAGSHGLFQFLRSTWARTPFARRSIYSAWWNAMAAAWLVRHDGFSWREWTCQP